MEKTVLGFFRQFFPLKKDDETRLKELAKTLTRKEVNDIKYLLKQRMVRLNDVNTGVSADLGNIKKYCIVALAKPDKAIQTFTDGCNAKIHEVNKKNIYEQFSKTADIINYFIAPNIIGMEQVKKAVVLQLFSKEKIHILLLGDPATGKTDILRSVNGLAPISSFGLGSGTTGVGLSISVSGKEISKGLLPMADNGICCIDELNLMKQEDQASLYNAMEKGFVTYDKGGTHLRYDARIRLLATANPKEGKFRLKLAEIKKQLPFEPALLSRFHLVFIIKKPSDEEFVQIAKDIITKDKTKYTKAEDLQFIKGYIDYAEELNVEFDTKLEPLVTDFIRQVKKDEDNYLYEISPRLVVGIINMSKARARMLLKKKTDKDDVNYILALVKSSLKV
jgi:replicative DNA helicase Mcm